MNILIKLGYIIPFIILLFIDWRIAICVGIMFIASENEIVEVVKNELKRTTV